MRSTCRAPQRFRVSDPMTVPLGFNWADRSSTTISDYLTRNRSSTGRQLRQAQDRLEADSLILFHLGERAWSLRSI
ncbi:MAG: hypothetical protein IPK92_12645 [Nitrospira sp.]|nr:hypothetical protein [Nitrospira sp.]